MQLEPLLDTRQYKDSLGKFNARLILQISLRWHRAPFVPISLYTVMSDGQGLRLRRGRRLDDISNTLEY